MMCVSFDTNNEQDPGPLPPLAYGHEKQSETELSERLAKAAQQVEVGARYMHYKQLSYTVVMLALFEENNEPCVVYRAEYGEHLTFIRPVSSWLEEIIKDGKKVKRFEKSD